MDMDEIGKFLRQQDRARRDTEWREERAARQQPVKPCPCECNNGGFCGGCGHAGCGGRR